MPPNFPSLLSYVPGINISYDAIIEQCRKRNLVYTDHVKVLGIFLTTNTTDTNKFIVDHVNNVISEHKHMFELLSHPDMPPQCAMILLRVCFLPRLLHFLRSLPPRFMRQACIEFDEQIVQAFIDIMELNVKKMPLTDKQKAQIELNISDGGMGLRSMLRVMNAAYVSAYLPLLPHIQS
ncbi:MAG TPA: hypothetical protein VHA52_13870, partial [Candidatus Babeliaceae bacterium]|nr:hypothetical protein [Candidatus Babeliaceae bacterium]